MGWCKRAFPQWWCAPADRNCLRTAGAFCRKFLQRYVKKRFLCRKISTLARWFNDKVAKYRWFYPQTDPSLKCWPFGTFEKTAWFILTDGVLGLIISLNWNGSCATKNKRHRAFYFIFLNRLYTGRIPGEYTKKMALLDGSGSFSANPVYSVDEACITAYWYIAFAILFYYIV